MNRDLMAKEITAQLNQDVRKTVKRAAIFREIVVFLAISGIFIAISLVAGIIMGNW